MVQRQAFLRQACAVTGPVANQEKNQKE